jgi:hypothetical protein
MIYRNFDISVITRLSSGIHSALKTANAHEAGLHSQPETRQLPSPWSLICPRCYCSSRPSLRCAQRRENTLDSSVRPHLLSYCHIKRH